MSASRGLDERLSEKEELHGIAALEPAVVLEMLADYPGNDWDF
jgi:hypothetical protein